MGDLFNLAVDIPGDVNVFLVIRDEIANSIISNKCIPVSAGKDKRR